jgi:sialic acid synthase SpsE
MLRTLELSRDIHVELMEHCSRLGILFLSSPFDDASADLLFEIGVSAFKVPSGELTNLPLLRRLAVSGRPLIISTGMANVEEVAAAFAVAAAAHAPVVLLHCVSLYPAPAETANLGAIAAMRRRFKVPVGYSDHTLGTAVALASVALGACVLEKHLTIDRGLRGPDHTSSLEPAEFARMVSQLREVESALGDGVKRPHPLEHVTMDAARKSVVAAAAIPAGTALTLELLALKRPGTGLPPSALSGLLGRRTRRDLSPDELLAMEDLE